MTSALPDERGADALAWQAAAPSGTDSAPMKIILITPGTGSYYCGVCMRDNALATELIRQGHDALMVPLYLPLHLDETSASPNAPRFFGGINVYLQEKFSIFRHTPRWLDRMFDLPGMLRMAAKRQGSANPEVIGQTTYSMLHGEKGHQRKELRRLIHWLKTEIKPDAVWLSTMLLTGFARELKRELGVPVLASLQGEDEFLDGLPKPWNRRAWELIIERSREVDLFISPSRFYAKLMTGRMRLQPDQLRLIPNGISTEGYGEPAPLPNPPVIGYLARMRAEKGLGLVVEAFITLKSRPGFANVKLRVAGAMTATDEIYTSKLKAEIAAAGLAKDVEFLPNIDRAEKVRFLKSLTLLTVPATYPEAFGLYVIEAWAAGVPVVQPRHAAFTELVEATGAGRLFEPERADDLASEWSLYLSAPETAREAGLRGRDAVLHGDFSIARMAESFLAATRDVINPAPAAL